MSDPSRRSNRLAHETSPYLLQHAKNPVDWYPWGPEALERARREGKPILLSIGYAACHWCHVMERESFEDEETAREMNDHFVCIKVDREERPDLDEIYMAATVAMTGHGGWPMTVFLTPEQQPFFAGTYFPPDGRHGQPGFRSLLRQIAEVWRTSPDRLREQARELTEHVRGESEVLPGSDPSVSLLEAAARQLARAFDEEHGGFGGAPKFPPCGSLSLLLRIHRRFGDESALHMVTTTLDAMRAGGIYDQLGGGFARYSVDAEWLVPHFEKMLYDNAQLARVYLEAYQVTKRDEYRRIATETLDYIVREMQGPEGGYYSATDADSEGVEGKFFVWKADEIVEVLGQPAAEAFCAYYGVTPEGNFEDANILHTPKPLPDVARELGISETELRASLARSREQLLCRRSQRVPPLTDDKVLASWNGLMIGAMAEGARVLGERRYLESARRAAEYVRTVLGRPDGGLYRTARAGKAHLDAYLEDYAFLADAFVDLYEAGASRALLDEGLRLSERIMADFGDENGGAFYQTAHGHESLIARPREGHDGAIPNANAIAARALSRLAFHFDRQDLRERALGAVRAWGKAMERTPRAFASALSVVDFLLEGPVELALVGTVGSADLAALREEVARHYLPNRVVAQADPDLDPEKAMTLPLLSGKVKVNGRAALYVCRDYACQAPVTRREAVPAVLGETATRLVDPSSRSLGSKVSGAATDAGTAAYAARFSMNPGYGYVPFSTTGLVVSRLGFGTYRVDDRIDQHRDALAHALRKGVNLIDTSTNYRDGHSERLVGEVVNKLATSGEVGRDAVVVVSKIGYVQGENYELATSREASGRPFPEMVKYGDGLWHCIHPEWLEDQLGRSLERLGMETLDVCLLHNPEYFLGHAIKAGRPLTEARAEFYRRVTAAFGHFEQEVARGRIRFYGVSSNSLVDAAMDPEATSASAFLEAAREAGGKEHHFRVLQLPMNLLEPGALLEKNTGPGGGLTALEFAERNGLAVLVNRPLNAFAAGKLVRLADPRDPGDAPPFADAVGKVRELEGEFRATIAPSLRMEGGDPARLFRWGEQLSSVGASIESLVEWEDLEARAVSPRILYAVEALDRGIGGGLAPVWGAFRERYLVAIEQLFAALRKRAWERSRRSSMALARALDTSLPPERRAASLSQKALFVVESAPGVTTTLVGMRSPEYVDDALPAMAWPPHPDPTVPFLAARNA